MCDRAGLIGEFLVFLFVTGSFHVLISQPELPCKVFSASPSQNLNYVKMGKKASQFPSFTFKIYERIAAHREEEGGGSLRVKLICEPHLPRDR